MGEYRFYFRRENRNPIKAYEQSCAQSAVNAVSIAFDVPWREVFDKLIAESHKLCHLPGEQCCINAMLMEYGLHRIRIPGDVDSICRFLLCEPNKIQAAVVKFPDYPYGGYMAAAVPTEDCRVELVGKEDRSTSRIEAVWVKQAGQDDFIKTSAAKKTVQLKMTRKYEDHQAYHCHNQNPADLNIGDCLIRATASILGMTWHEAVDILAECGDYGYTDLNTPPVFIPFLYRYGFEKHEPILRNGKMLTGSQFCEMMTHTLTNKEPVFAFIGSSHVAAVLPFREENGDIIYKIDDTWDSSACKVGQYFIRKTKTPSKPETDRRKLELTDLSAGTPILHPKYGNGQILEYKEGNQSVQVVFPETGTKKFAVKWVLENCFFPG